jgi:hypothetical protein
MSQWHIKEPISALVINPGVNPTPPAEHNYIRKLILMRQAGMLAAAGACELYVHHDDWCGVFSGGRCDCDPIIDTHPIRP